MSETVFEFYGLSPTFDSPRSTGSLSPFEMDVPDDSLSQGALYDRGNAITKQRWKCLLALGQHEVETGFSPIPIPTFPTPPSTCVQLPLEYEETQRPSTPTSVSAWSTYAPDYELRDGGRARRAHRRPASVSGDEACASTSRVFASSARLQLAINTSSRRHTIPQVPTPVGLGLGLEDAGTLESFEETYPGPPSMLDVQLLYNPNSCQWDVSNDLPWPSAASAEFESDDPFDLETEMEQGLCYDYPNSFTEPEAFQLDVGPRQLVSAFETFHLDVAPRQFISAFDEPRTPPQQEYEYEYEDEGEEDLQSELELIPCGMRRKCVSPQVDGSSRDVDFSELHLGDSDAVSNETSPPFFTAYMDSATGPSTVQRSAPTPPSPPHSSLSQLRIRSNYPSPRRRSHGHTQSRFRASINPTPRLTAQPSWEGQKHRRHSHHYHPHPHFRSSASLRIDADPRSPNILESPSCASEAEPKTPIRPSLWRHETNSSTSCSLGLSFVQYDTSSAEGNSSIPTYTTDLSAPSVSDDFGLPGSSLVKPLGLLPSPEIRNVRGYEPGPLEVVCNWAVLPPF